MTPLLDDELSGGVYLRPQASDDPASGDMFRIMLNVVNEDRGIDVKLVGRSPLTPPGPVDGAVCRQPAAAGLEREGRAEVRPSGRLATPRTCGTTSVAAQLTSWAGKSADLSSAHCKWRDPGLGAFSAGVLGRRVASQWPVAPHRSCSGSQAGRSSRSERAQHGAAHGLLANLKGNIGTRVGTARRRRSGCQPVLAVRPRRSGGPVRRRAVHAAGRCRRRPDRSTSVRSWCGRRSTSIPITAQVTVCQRSGADDRQGRAGAVAAARRSTSTSPGSSSTRRRVRRRRSRGR